MKKSLAKDLKLTLNRETLRTLEEPVLRVAHGDAAASLQPTACGTCHTTLISLCDY
jgi:hypothetical protein